MARNVLAGRNMEQLAAEYVARQDPNFPAAAKMYSTYSLYQEMRKRCSLEEVNILLAQAREIYIMVHGSADD